MNALLIGSQVLMLIVTLLKPTLILGQPLCGTPLLECAKYARLLAPLAKAKAEWEAAGGISEGARNRTRATVHSVSGAFMTIAKGNAFIEFGGVEGYETRLYSSLMLLQRAMDRLGRKHFPDVEFGINPEDEPRGDAFFSYCRPKSQFPGNWVWPDWMFYAWPEVGAETWPVLMQQVEAVVQEVPFRQRSNKMFWRGTIQSPVRITLVDKYGKRQDIADVGIVDFNRLRDELNRDPTFNISSLITTLADHCRYKYIIYTEGRTWSTRLKAHLLCGSVILTHPMQWESFESAVLEEGKHMMSSDIYWDSLEELYRRLEADPGLAESIAANNDEMRSLLDEDGISCYILESLKCFKDVMRYNVTQSPVHHATGMSLENFLLAKMKPNEHLSHLKLGR